MRKFQYPEESFCKKPGSELPVLDWASLHSAYGPAGVTLEIGCGVGLHPIQACLKNPQHFRVAIEHTSEKFARFWSRVESHRKAGKTLENLLPLHANAIEWVVRRTPDDRPVLGQIDLMYPNPNWKPKLASQRWMRMPFMGRLLQSLHGSGTLRLCTNVREYAEEAREWGEKEWNLWCSDWRTYTRETLPSGYEALGGRTHFEIKYLASGQTCFELVFQKRA